MRKYGVNKLIAFILLLTFSLSLVLPAELAKAVENGKTASNKTGNTDIVGKQTENRQTAVQFPNPRPDKGKKEKAVLDKVKGMGAPFVPNQGQIKDKNIAYYADIFAGTVSVTHDGQIAYELVKYEEVSEAELQTQKIAKDNPNLIKKEVLRKKSKNGKDSKDSKDIKDNYGFEKQMQYKLKQVNKITEKLVGATEKITVAGNEEAVTKVNYFSGKNQQDWRTNLATYKKIKMGEIYPGIELTLKSSGSNVEKVFTVNPGGNVENIRISVEGAKSLKVDEKGQLEVGTSGDPVIFTAPIAYQEINGSKVYVSVSYFVQGTTYGFKTGEYDPTKPLIIDPLLAATFYGGDRHLCAIDLDSQGNVYVIGQRFEDILTISKFNPNLTTLLTTAYLNSCDAGWATTDDIRKLRIDNSDNVYILGATDDPNYPTTPGAYSTVLSGGSDIVITKFNANLDTILASTFFDGRTGCYLELDQSGNVYIAGVAGSSDFPTTPGAFSRQYKGNGDIFISKFDADLTTLQASTLLGSSSWEYLGSLMLDGEGNIYVSGSSNSYYKDVNDFPITEGAYQTTIEGNNYAARGFISKFNATLSTLEVSTFIDVDYVAASTLDSEGNVYVVGSGNYEVQKYSANLDQLLAAKKLPVVYITYPEELGWPDECSISVYSFIKDNNDNIYIVGDQGLAVKLDSDLSLRDSYYVQGLPYMDYFNNCYAVVNDQGYIYMCGIAYSNVFIVTEGAYDTNRNDEYSSKGFISLFSLGNEGSLEFSLGNPSWGGAVGQNINICNGNFFLGQTDLSIPTRSLPLNFTRYYNSRSSYTGCLGKGWQHNYNTCLLQNADNSITVIYGDGHQAKFKKTGTNYMPIAGCWEELAADSDGTYLLTFKNQTKYTYTATGKLQSITDKNNNQTTLQYTGEQLTTVTEPAGRTLQFSYNAHDQLVKVLDPAGRYVQFTYDAAGNLASVRDLNGKTTTYTYDSLGLTTITNPQNNPVVTNTYDSESKVIRQKDGKNNIINISYDSVTRQNTYTDYLNNTSVYTHDLDYKLRKIAYNNNEAAVFEYDGCYNLLSAKDFNGNITEYQYSDAGNLTEKSVAGHPGKEHWVYNRYNNITSYQDGKENKTTFTYDANGNLISGSRVVSGQTEESTFQYNQYGQLTQSTDADNKTTVMAYDQDGNLLTVTDPANNTTSFTYDAAGRVVTKTDPKNGFWDYTYDNLGNVLTVAEPGLADSINYTYDSCGNLTGITDQRGKTTVYAYDHNNNLTQVTDPLLNMTTFTYDANNNCRTITNAKGQTTTYNYDHRDRLISVTDNSGNTESHTLDGNGNITARTDTRNNTVQYQYDFENRLVKVTDPRGNSFSSEYDLTGNKITDTDPFGNRTCYTYDEASRLLSVKDPLNNIVSSTYDKTGQITAVTDAKNNSTSYTYDNCGRIKTVTDAQNNVTTYSYDGNGNLTNILDAKNNACVLEYDALNRETQEVDAKGNSIAREYDPAGNLIAVTTADGETISCQYDALNRLTQKSYPDGTAVTYTYNELGQRTAMTDPAGTTTYTYDNLSRLETVTRNGSTVTYAYDAVGNITGMTYPDNLHLDYIYNELDLPETVSDGTKTHSITYDQAARPLQETMPNGVNVNYDFDECGRLTLLENKLNQTVIAKSAYTYDANSNRISVTNENGQVTNYAYNALDQLEGVTTQGGSNTQYSYDEVGNKLSADESINNTEPTNDYQYDYEDRLIQTTKGNDTITYTYDGDGTLVEKTITGSVNMTYEYFYDYTAGLPRLLVEKKSDGTTYDYLYVGGKLYGRKDSTGTIFYHQDGLGSVVAITGENGNILNKYAYDPFGEPHILQETVENSMLFTGEPFDQSGLIYLRARYYDPKTGRFVTSDKYKGKIADPISQNSYAYCGNNPINAVDPSGNSAFSTAIPWAGGIACLDSPVVGPADLVAGGLLLGAALVDVLTADSTSDVKAKAEPVTIAKEDQNRTNQGTVIYRWGNYTNTNFTPRPQDTNGLSFAFLPGPGHNCVTTMEQINSTGYLKAVQDGPNHVSVKPAVGCIAGLNEWIASRPNAENKPHLFTIKLMGVCKKFN